MVIREFFLKDIISIEIQLYTDDTGLKDRSA